MKFLLQFVLTVAFCALASVQLSAQCSNINSKSVKGPGTHIFGTHSVGQSVWGACFSGNKITKFSFWSQGNSPTKLSFQIFEGKRVSGTPIHQQDVSLPPANMGGKLTIELDEPVFVQSNKIYTFLLTLNASGGGNLIAHVSDNRYAGGELYIDKKDGSAGFKLGYDMRFEIETVKTSLDCGNASMSVQEVSGNTIKIKVENSTTFTYFPPNTGGTIMAFENVSSNLTRADGVGPQGKASPYTWTVTRTDPSKPAIIKFKSGGCAGKSLVLTN